LICRATAIVEWYGDPQQSPVYRCSAQKMKRLGVKDHTALQQVFAGDWREHQGVPQPATQAAATASVQAWYQKSSHDLAM
jgi:hypothetical protein